MAAAKMLGIQLPDEKHLGPTVVIMYLGIELDSMKMEARIPQDRPASEAAAESKCV